MDAKALGEKIRQKQADDDEFFLTFGRWAGLAPLNYVAFYLNMVACNWMLGDIDNFLEKGKLAQVVCVTVRLVSSDALGYLNVNYERSSQATVSVFTPRPSEHYLNITKKNVVKVFRKDTISLA
ncbi:hypothetical protein Tco_1384613 [Tanacetum coccineum]